MLGMSADKLNDMRLKGEIFGTRDGAAWKFRLDEIQRFADERNISLGAVDMAEDSEFRLSDESLELSFGSSEALLEEGGKPRDKGDLSFGSSDLALASGSEEDALASDEAGEKGSPSDTGKLLADSAELQLSEDDLFDDEISLQDSASLVDSAELSSDFEDSDLVLEDSDSSDEPALEIKSSPGGISLSPNESGISLDEPFDLGGSDIDDLELPEDDDVIALEESAGRESTLLSDDNFDLTPLEDSGLDESSGSQVIALEDSGIYADDSAPTMLGVGDAVEIEEAPVMLDDTYGRLEGTQSVTLVQETPYTLLNVIALSAALVMVVLSTMVAYDVARNMWQPEDTQLSNTVANMFMRLTGFSD
jgi:hypothetical protein